MKKGDRLDASNTQVPSEGEYRIIFMYLTIQECRVIKWPKQTTSLKQSDRIIFFQKKQNYAGHIMENKK